MKTNRLIVAQGEWPAQDIPLPQGGLIRGHRAINLYHTFETPIITDRPLRYIIELVEPDKEVTNFI